MTEEYLDHLTAALLAASKEPAALNLAEEEHARHLAVAVLRALKWAPQRGYDA